MSAMTPYAEDSDLRAPTPVPIPVLSVKYIPCARPDTSPMKYLKILTKATSFCKALGQLEVHRKEMHAILDEIESTLPPEQVVIMREYINKICAAHAETLKAPT